MSGKPLICECGECTVCRARERMRLLRQRDPERVRAQDRARYRRDYEKRRAAYNAYLETPEGREAKRRAASAWDQRNPEKKRAAVAVNNAVRDGRLTKLPCEICDDPKADGHHSDYAKPLEVMWLCRKHHVQVHLMMREFAAWEVAS